MEVEFNILYRWHQLAPETFGDTPVEKTLWDTAWLTKRGFDNVINEASKQNAHRFGARASAEFVKPVAKATLKHTRELRIASFNAYRKRFGLTPYQSFDELTGKNEELNEVLKKYYTSIDEVEYYVGLLCESIPKGSIFPQTLTTMVLAHAMKGIFSNPICSPHLWKPETFGSTKGSEADGPWVWIHQMNLEKFVGEVTNFKHASFATKSRENFFASNKL